MSVAWRAPAVLLAAAALMASGAAALVNQVAWQGSLRRFLGGSEALSSMVVVLVFMAGLGFGSLAAGRLSSRLPRPLIALAAVEAGLGILNLAVRAVLDGDLPATALRVQGVAVSLGVPLLVVCAVGSTVLLLLPCLAMGATLPLASEACQRELGLRDSRVLGLLFGLNTLGSVAGAAVGSAVLLPALGHSGSLRLAAFMNILAGVAFLALARGARASAEKIATLRPAVEPPRRGWRTPSVDELLAMGLGFCSLGYEMYLLRLIPLRHEPLPMAFAAVVAGFLLFWSLGAALTIRMRLPVAVGLLLTAVGIASSVVAFQFDQPRPVTGLDSLARFVLMRSFYFVPCLLFGALFAQVTERAARSWGVDVGRLVAFNTLGSCAGVTAVTLLGYEVHVELLALGLGGLLLGLVAVESPPRHLRSGLAWAVGGTAVVVLLAMRSAAQPPLWVGGGKKVTETYFGRNGVIGIDPERNLFWNGLWHSRLARGGDYVGTTNWMLAAASVLSHRGGARDACVIGLGTGVTAATLARLGSLQHIDTYEINPTLRKVYARHPEGMLGVLENPKIRMAWQDARIGLALDPQKYDIVVSQPLYLRQAGSGLLNSVEFYRAVAARLKTGGVFCLYSNGSPRQAFAVRQTAAQVFRCGESFLSGYLLVLSEDPIALTPEALRARFEAGTGDPLWEEIRRYPGTQDEGATAALLDRPRLPWGDGRLLITDDRPIVEYEGALNSEIARLGYRESLPGVRKP